MMACLAASPSDTVRLNKVVIPEYVNTVTPDASVRKTKTGIIIIGRGENVRAVEPFGGSKARAAEYAQAANHYKKVFGDAVNVYLTAIPTAVEYYCPDAAKSWTNSERNIINYMFASLDSSVIPVDIYTPIGEHADEAIYSRTDHHWAPLGAFYAAEAFAATAGVPFKDLSYYTRHVVRNYVGTMYGFSKDAAVKNAPEDFVYFTPDSIDYTTVYTTYNMDKSRKNILSTNRPKEGQFFFHYKDGSSGAYCTFMGGDTKITQVNTATKNGRKLIIFKDSYGNALPGYLFYSFEEIHVIDFRYFNKNIKTYVKEHGITDILFANNVILACSGKPAKSYLRFLQQ